jgi:DNA-binding CsgD family transcriptional regulator
MMPLNSPRFNSVPPSIRLYSAAEKLSRLQIDLISEAVKRAVDDVGAAIAHQLSEPLTALLLYLHEIKRDDERLEGAGVVPLVDSALREAERACSIMERLGHTDETPVDAETALARGRGAIDGWARQNHDPNSDAAPLLPSYVSHYLLTPREREVLGLITGGASNKEGGHRLGISTRTFEVHRAHLMGKLGARNAADLVRIALSSL